uniref:Choline transporter-like protein n=1 Tax=Denticeps clupeoides TaxID=299321 RepID=A0AAY4DZR9_9TELE
KFFLFSGEPSNFDPTFNGPIKNRSCTDIICCILFMLVLVGYMIVGILAWLYGDPRQVLYPRNSTGMFCGIGPNSDKPNVFYFDILKCATATNIMAAALNGLQCPTVQLCVNQCPSDFWVLPVTAYLPGALPQNFFKQEYCVPSLNLSTTALTVSQIKDKELCSYFYMPTAPGWFDAFIFLNRRSCSTGSTRPVLGVPFMFLRSVYTFYFSVYISIDFKNVLNKLLPVFFTGIWYCWNEYNTLKGSTVTFQDVGFTTNFNAYLQIKDTWLAFMIILCIVEGILLLTLIFLRTRILIAIAIIRESSKAVSYMMSTLFFPLVTFVLLLVCVSYWGITALYLATSGAPVFKVVALNASQGDCSGITGNQTCDPVTFNSSSYPTCPSARCMFINYNAEGLYQRNLFNLQIYNVVAFLWCINFVIALGQCTLAGAFASYYWAFSKPGDIPTFPLSQSFIRTLRYHVGSLAFGALILTLVQIVRIILEYLDHKFRAAQNPCARFVMCCLKCCFWCLEKFIKFINRNAYIMIAIYGKNFCVSAKNAFMLLMRNIVRVVVLDKVTDLLLFFGKLLVVGGVGVLAFYFFSGKIPVPSGSFQASKLNYYWMPIITVIVGSYLIAQGFFSVYSMCVDTLFLCFLEDLERHDGSVEKPYFMSKNLMKILHKKNKKPKGQKD